MDSTPKSRGASVFIDEPTAATTEEGSITEQVYQRLMARILTCELKPGAPLRESRLGREHGVSGLPIRMALTRLAAEGLAEQIYNRGYFVTRINVNDLRESFELRKIVEPAVAALAAERIGAADRERLRAFCNAHFVAGAASPGGRAEEIAEDRRFHELLAEIAHNTQLARAVDRFWHQYIRMGYLLGRESDLIVGDYEHSKAGHARIADAVIAGRPDVARELMLEHCTSAERNLIMIAGTLSP